MQLKEIMTHNVHAIPPETTLRHAAQKMKSWDVGALPVCHNDKLVGVITDRDIAIRAVAEGEDPDTCPVSEAMTRDLTCCREEDEFEQAVKMMEQRQIRRVPVVDRHEHLVGIISLGDIAVRQQDRILSHEVLLQVSQPTQ